jgi:glutamyl-tRNA synthetase
MATEPARVRFAPSPTGYLHIGGARTALFDWLYARHTGGQFILRIEDTDRTRYVKNSLEDIYTNLRWLGLDWDEGPDVGGPYGPYVQSERLPIYREYAEKLVAAGHAYRCYCTPERLEALRAEQRARKEPPGYDRHCRWLTSAQRAEREAAGVPWVIRFAVPLEGETTFHDLIRGEITVENRTLDDLVLLKSDGFPTYHLANVVDDHLMRITHILRGDEWLPSVPRHILMYQAFGWQPPVMAHLPIILDPSGKGKMSKRRRSDGTTYLFYIKDFREAGYLPEALFNFLSLLGWSYDAQTDIFTKEQAIARFDVRDVIPKPTAISYAKLEWMNGVYIRALSVEELVERITPFVAKGLGIPEGELRARHELRDLAPHIQERMKTLADAVALVDFAFRQELDYDPAFLIGKNMTAAESYAALAAARRALAELPDFEEATLETRLRALATELGLKAGQLFGIIRVAVTGKTVAPPLFGTLKTLGRERSLARMDKALAQLAKLSA